MILQQKLVTHWQLCVHIELSKTKHLQEKKSMTFTIFLTLHRIWRDRSSWSSWPLWLLSLSCLKEKWQSQLAYQSCWFNRSQPALKPNPCLVSVLGLCLNLLSCSLLKTGIFLFKWSTSGFLSSCLWLATQSAGTVHPHLHGWITTPYSPALFLTTHRNDVHPAMSHKSGQIQFNLNS